MKLLIKQRVFSWTDTYDVYDENGAPKYFVRPEDEVMVLLLAIAIDAANCTEGKVP